MKGKKRLPYKEMRSICLQKRQVMYAMEHRTFWNILLSSKMQVKNVQGAGRKS